MLAGLVFTWMVTAGRADLLQQPELAHYYDAQARTLFNGHWDMPPAELGIEAWIIDGKSYMYFGPVPTVMRMPVLALTDAFDGRLSQLSMIAALAVLLVFTTRLSWRVRVMVRGAQPVGKLEAWAAGVFMLTVGAGSVLLFLASRPVVYHEAELWGATLAMASYDFLVAFMVRPERRSLVGAGVFAGLAFMTRPSVGLGPVVALGVLLAVRLAIALRRRVGWDWLLRPLRWLGVGPDEGKRFPLAGLGLAVAVPAIAYMYVNYVKFRHPWRLPSDRHFAVVEGIDADKIAALDANGGSHFGLKFVPTNVLAMLRPDGLRLDGVFPWITFPPPARMIGDVKFDTVDWSGSIPATMPLLFVLAVVGAIAVFRRRQRASSEAAPSPAVLRLPVLAAFAGGFVTLTIHYVAHRYLSDFLPLLLILGVVGLHLLLQWLERARQRRLLARVAIIGLVALAGFSLWANAALALLYQRVFNEFVMPSERAAFVGFQYEIDRLVPGRSRFDLGRGDTLPSPEAALADTLFVVGDCQGVYWTDGETWFGVERTAAAGLYPLEVVFPDRPSGTRETLLRAGSGDDVDRVVVEYRDEGRVVFALHTAFPEIPVIRSQPIAIDPGRSYRLDVVVDANVGRFDLVLDDTLLEGLTVPIQPGPVAIAGVGAPTDDVDFSGRVAHQPAAPVLCPDLLAAS